MTDHIIEIPDDAGIGPDHEESMIETLQIQVGAPQEPRNNFISQSPPTKSGLVESQAGEHSSSEGSGTLPLDARSSSKKAEEPNTVTSVPESYNNRGLYDIVLGVSIKDFNVDAVEAIIITFEQTIGTFSPYKSEVISPAELKRLCAGVPNKYIDANKNAETNKEDVQQSEDEPGVATVSSSAEGVASVINSSATAEDTTDNALGRIAGQGVEKEEKEEKDGGDDKEKRDGDESEKEKEDEKKVEEVDTILR
ncbi:hypothetical protein BGW39_002014 [Mortierella sp. 14UC]|nr:hypothetical protein BGW39_002014 [Mortierella sp. 14UC]